MSERGFIEIEVERYQELLDTECRVIAVTELLEADKNMSMEIILRVLGGHRLIEIADKMKHEREEILLKFREGNNGDSV